MENEYIPIRNRIMGDELRRKLENGIVTFYYHKVDENKKHIVEKVVGTNLPKFIKTKLKGCPAPYNPTIIHYWSFTKNDWRTIKILDLLYVE